MKKLQKSFFLGHDVLGIARSLLGKYLFTMKEGQIAGGIISEVEAYKGTADRGSHAYGGRRTRRNEMMYHQGGVAYIYRCYGIHNLLNFVTNEADEPDAVLVRGIIPTHGEELMLLRSGKRQASPYMATGPGRVSRALGLTMEDNGRPLDGDVIWLEDRGLETPSGHIAATPRIGIDYAGPDALLPYRFVLHYGPLPLASC